MAIVTVAGVQAAYILMNQPQACLDKAITLIHQAAAGGAKILVVPRGIHPRNADLDRLQDHLGWRRWTGTRCWSTRPLSWGLAR